MNWDATLWEENDPRWSGYWDAITEDYGFTVFETPEWPKPAKCRGMWGPTNERYAGRYKGAQANGRRLLPHVMLRTGVDARSEGASDRPMVASSLQPEETSGMRAGAATSTHAEARKSWVCIHKGWKLGTEFLNSAWDECGVQYSPSIKLVRLFNETDVHTVGLARDPQSKIVSAYKEMLFRTQKKIREQPQAFDTRLSWRRVDPPSPQGEAGGEDDGSTKHTSIDEKSNSVSLHKKDSIGHSLRSSEQASNGSALGDDVTSEALETTSDAVDVQGIRGRTGIIAGAGHLDSYPGLENADSCLDWIFIGQPTDPVKIGTLDASREEERERFKGFLEALSCGCRYLDSDYTATSTWWMAMRRTVGEPTRKEAEGGGGGDGGDGQNGGSSAHAEERARPGGAAPPGPRSPSDLNPVTGLLPLRMPDMMSHDAIRRNGFGTPHVDEVWNTLDLSDEVPRLIRRLGIPQRQGLIGSAYNGTCENQSARTYFGTTEEKDKRSSGDASSGAPADVLRAAIAEGGAARSICDAFAQDYICFGLEPPAQCAELRASMERYDLIVQRAL